MIEPTWPKHGPDFNAWNTDIAAFGKLVQDAADEHWWACDPPLKYLQIRVDTRDGGFILSDRDGNRIDPSRVTKAIEKHRTNFGTHKLGLIE